MDLYKQNQYFTTAINVSGGIDDTQTTGIIIQDDSGIYDKTAPGIALLSYASPLDTDVSEWITFSSVNTTTKELNGVTRGAEGFSAKSHANGSVVAFPHSKSHINNLVEMFTEKGLELTKLDSTPTTPDAGKTKIYVGDGTTDTDNSLIILDDDGSKSIVFPTLTDSERQIFLNGGFDIWQRGSSFTSSEYTADMWYQSLSASTVTTTRQQFSLGQSDVPGNPQYYLRSVVTSASTASSYVAIQQRVEDVATLSGDKLTVSFWAKADTNKNISIQVSQDFGSGGSPSADVSVGVEKIAITSNWQRHSATFTMSSVFGKTLGTGKDDHIKVIFWLEAGSDHNASTDSLGNQSGTFEFANVQGNKGTISLPFYKKSKGKELFDCYRFCEVIGYEFSSRDVVGPGYFFDTNTIVAEYYFKNRKKKDPTVTYPTGISGDDDYSISRGGSTYFIDNSTFSSVGAGVNGLIFSADTISGTGTVGESITINVRSGDAKIIASCDF